MSEKLKLTPSQQKASIGLAKRSMSLRSGAGCGKTFVLARRYTELLLNYAGSDNPLSRYVALTFTEKAAIEMNVRVRKMLRQFAADAAGSQRGRLREYIDDLPEARISTIHSFCASLLRTHAIEAGIDPAFSVCADSLLINQLCRQSAQKAILEDLENNSPHARAALDYLNFNKLLELTVKLLAHQREHWTPQEYSNPETIHGNWITTWKNNRQAGLEKLENDNEIYDSLENLASFICTDPSDKLEIKRSQFIDTLRLVLSDPLNAAYEQAYNIANFKTGSVGSQKAWGSSETVKEVRGIISGIAKLMEKYLIFFREMDGIDRSAATVLCSLIQLAARADTIFTAEKRSRGILDFADLVICTHRLLEKNPQIRRQIASQIDQLLVDECQDTDAYQLSMLKLLFDDGNESQAAFMVGDPKQSIYRFRGADVNVFENLCRELGKGCSETLDVSFRTHDGGVEFVNDFFAGLIKDYEPTTAHRRKTWANPSVEFLLADSKTPLKTADQAADAQAAVTAKRIKQMLDGGEKIIHDRAAGNLRPVKAGDIAILFSRMTNSLSYEKYLQRLDVPYYVLGGSGFFQQQEIYDLLNILSAIDNPLNDIALMGVLRGGLIGLDDNALMRISGRLEGGPYYPKLQTAALDEFLDTPQVAAIKNTLEIITSLGTIKNAAGIAEILQRTIDLTGYTAVLMSQFNAERMVANVRQLIQLARDADNDAITLGDFVSQIDTLTVDEERYEQAVVSGEADDVVKLMTIHKSKGLEFPVVFIPDLNSGEKGCTEKDMLYRNEWGLTLNLHPSVDDPDRENERPLAFEVSKLEESNELNDERIRRLYVAATRHEDYLVFVAADLRKKDGGIKEKDSYIDLLDRHFNILNAIDSGQNEVCYGDGKYLAHVRKELSDDIQNLQPANKLAREIIKQSKTPAQLAQAILASAAQSDTAPPLAGIIPPHIGSIEAAVTAMGDFEHCPKLFQWRYELNTPADALVKKTGRPPVRQSPDAAALGTIFHRCMELLDFSNPQDPHLLVSRACREMEIEDADVSQITAQLQQMLDMFKKHPLFESLGNADKKFAELDFILKLPQISLKGQIDLIYRDNEGKWRIVDYKSDRVDECDIPEHSKRYELQMLTYALAARQGEMNPEDVTLYYLRTGKTFEFKLGEDVLNRAKERIENLVKRIIIARRSGRFEPNRGEFCQRCPYQILCGNITGT